MSPGELAALRAPAGRAVFDALDALDGSDTDALAASTRLRALAAERAERAGITLRVPRPKLCTDNGAMVAALGSHLVAAGVAPSPLDFPADSSMLVTEVSLVREVTR